MYYVPYSSRGSRNRTDDILLPKQALYQTELHPDVSGPPWIRTKIERFVVSNAKSITPMDHIFLAVITELESVLP